MSFVTFAQSYGLIIEHPVRGRWVKVSTVDHPRKKNGSYKFEGSVGWVQNFASMLKPAMWMDKNYVAPDPAQVQRDIKKAEEQRRVRQLAAAKKAGWIMHNAKCGHHPYLSAKGFPKEKGWVFDDKLVIPMRVNGDLVGCQMIDAEGNKRFLTGQLTKGASASFDAKGRVILCEGYATALSIRAALKHAKVRYHIIVCFSAGNIAEIASKHPDCFIVADHDKSETGQRVAKKTGRPFWISPVVGEDFNDYSNRVGLEESSLVISALIG